MLYLLGKYFNAAMVNMFKYNHNHTKRSKGKYEDDGSLKEHKEIEIIKKQTK